MLINHSHLFSSKLSYTSVHYLQLYLVLLLQQLRDGLQLDIACPLVDGTNLTVPPKLLGQAFPHKAHSTHPLDRAPRDPLRNLRRIQLCHRSLAHKALARLGATGLLDADRVVHQCARSLNLGACLRNLELHSLELANVFAKLFAVVPDILDGVLPRTEGEACHLGSDTDASFVQERDGVFVALALVAEEIFSRHLNVVKGQYAGAARSDSEFLLLLCDFEAGHALVEDEGGDALVAALGGDVGEDDENVGFNGVGDPHLLAGDFVGAAGSGFNGFGLESEGIGAGAGLRKAEGTDGVGG